MNSVLDRLLPAAAGVILMGVLAAAPGGAAQAAEEKPAGDSPLLVSESLMLALEHWSDPATSLEWLALETHPEALHDYVRDVKGALRGRGLLEHLQLSYPQAYEGIMATLPAEDQTDAEALAQLISGHERDYALLQAELEPSGLDFERWARSRQPELVAAFEREAPSPASRGVSLEAFVDSLDDAALSSEARRLFDVIAMPWDPLKNCTCWTVATFPHQPDPWQVEINENYNHSWGSFRVKRQQLNYRVAARGAAKDIDFYRRSRHTTYEAERSKNTNYAEMRVRMHCTRNGQPGGVECSGNVCSGQLASRISYGSRVHQRVAFGGPWSKEARSLAADLAMLRYDPPGPPPQQTLFSKGVAVSGFTSSNWQSQALIQVLTTAAQVGLTMAMDGSSAASLLQGNLVNDTITALFGLIKREGSQGTRQQDMYASWDTAGSAPIALLPNQTHLFQLETFSKVYGRGYGGDSESWANIDSAAWFAAVARNYQCPAHVQAPSPRAWWFWSTSGAPMSPVTLQNLVRNYVTAELGTMPSNVSQPIAHFP
ncbi:MAG: hypothetical protein MEQ07_02020 [Aquimonas sp.]|nr:hypothetical protein [Aquimonas sp.]